ncbi:MAG: carcinine hydrolase/isopenicillin-N N-acyltransferase family protein [Pseudomonadota bacterium]
MRSGLTLLLVVVLGLAACEDLQPPPTFEVMELRGSDYDRGFAHGQRFSSKIRSFYTQMLTTSLLPFLNREQPDIASVLLTYQDPIYADGTFSYQMLLRSGIELEADIPQPYLDEMHGIADGAGLDYKIVLILNTFLDTMVGMRSITFFIRKTQAPELLRLYVDADLAHDGIDNDGDGAVDQPGEGVLDPFMPSRHASLVGVPPSSAVVLEFEDADGVRAEGIRILHDQTLYVASDPAMQHEVFGDQGQGLRVRFAPPGGFAPGRAHTLQISAGDRSWVTDPPPARARQARDQRIVFTTAGDGRAPHEVENRGFDDGRSQPPSISFALRGSATLDGEPLLAQHFGLLDSNTSHKHAVMFVHYPEQGMPHATLGWAGIVSGFTGVNQAGLGLAVNMSDTLDNPMVDEFRRLLVAAELKSSGMPVGFVGREVLRQAHNVEEARAIIERIPPTFGWNILLADAAGDMRAIELDGAILGSSTEVGAFSYTPDVTDPGNLDAWGRPHGSVGPDDLRMASHFQKNEDDIDFSVFSFKIQAQRTWSSFYYRSLRSFYELGDVLADRYGAVDAEGAQRILSLPVLVDQRDSMFAAVLEPSRMRWHVAMGQVPATSAPFRSYDLRALLGEPAP